MPRPPRVFISRSTAGLAALAEQVAGVQRQQTFITEFAKDGRNTYGTKRSANAEVRMQKFQPIHNSYFPRPPVQRPR